MSVPTQANAVPPIHIVSSDMAAQLAILAHASQAFERVQTRLAPEERAALMILDD